MNRHIMPMLAALLLMLIVFAVLCDSIITHVSGASRKNIILIDPGHGGIDGGAESSDGTPEKDINLAVSLYLRAYAQQDGWRVVMTRDEDRDLDNAPPGSIHSFKVADLEARKTLIDDTCATVTVSIHLNSFREDSGVKGAQVFYPADSSREDVCQASHKLADDIQQSLIDGLKPEKERTAMTKQGVKILEEPLSPIVIVECGFLSNPEESQKLKTVAYQKELAKYIYKGIMKFTGVGHLNDVRIIDSAR